MGSGMKGLAMSTTLVATSGRNTGSAASRRLRREEKIPAVIYGQGMDPISVLIERRDLRNALSGAAGSNTILEISVDGNVYPAVVKEMQRHPVRRTVAHIDFVQINLSEEITMQVPVHLVGTAKAVVSAGGLVDPAVDTIEVRTTPANVPNEISIDISDLTPDSVIRLSEIPMPAGVSAIGDPDMPVVTVLMSRAATEAAKDAAVYQNIIEFEQGFETLIGERGITLSGGQKQRISIARAIIKEPQILIFDDCLSAVDTKTEEEILQNLGRVMKGKTSILISHRVSTIKNADKIIVLEQGRIVEQGTHRQLIENRNSYFELYNKQLLEEEI